ncbi:MAG: hypothetical protein BRC24_00300 [Parcubacteria group bacterium SW_4_46_8]|nr:MAG: hypothetical protein BRC24_00300 [Parcubacteria group bacterium SW_4_46_8]
MSDESQQDLKEQHKQFRTKTFRFILELIVIFGGPALAALFAGRYLDGVYGTGRTITIILLIFTFILSWVITIWRTRQIEREFDKTEKKLRQTKKEKEVDTV